MGDVEFSKEDHLNTITAREIIGAIIYIITFSKEIFMISFVISFIASAIGRGIPNKEILLGPIRKCM